MFLALGQSEIGAAPGRVLETHPKIALRIRFRFRLKKSHEKLTTEIKIYFDFGKKKSHEKLTTKISATK